MVTICSKANCGSDQGNKAVLPREAWHLHSWRLSWAARSDFVPLPTWAGGWSICPLESPSNLIFSMSLYFCLVWSLPVGRSWQHLSLWRPSFPGWHCRWRAAAVATARGGIREFGWSLLRKLAIPSRYNPPLRSSLPSRRRDPALRMSRLRLFLLCGAGAARFCPDPLTLSLQRQ